MQHDDPSIKCQQKNITARRVGNDNSKMTSTSTKHGNELLGKGGSDGENDSAARDLRDPEFVCDGCNGVREDVSAQAYGKKAKDEIEYVIM